MVIDESKVEVVIDILENSLFVEYDYEVELLEERALTLLKTEIMEYLAHIALKDTIAPDIRGIAAKLFSKKENWCLPCPIEELLIDRLITNKEPLVRLGFILGLEENRNDELLKKFVNDSCPRIRLEVKRLQNKYKI